MGNLAGWPFWKDISITGQAGAGTDYQVELEIGDSAGGDFHLEGHCTNFPQDIRITDNDGTTLLDHYVVDLTADPIVVYVEVKDDLGSNRDIRVYYGKSGETTASNIGNTFLLGDEFSAALDSNKWTTVSGEIATSGGKLQLLGTVGTRGLIEQNTTNYPAISIGAALEVQCHSTSPATSSHFTTMRKAGDWAHRIDIFGISSDDDIDIYSGNGVDYDTSRIYNVGLTSSHRWTIEWYSGNAKYYKDGNILATHTIYVPSVDLVAAFGEGEPAGNNSYIDYMFVRKFNSPEPAFSSAGAEQTPTGVPPTGVFYGPLVGPFGGPI